LTKDFENIVYAIEESSNLEDLTINDLEDSFEAHKQHEKKEKHEVLEEDLQIKISINEDKVYT